MKILLTGSKGQLGGAVQRVFSAHEIVAVDIDEVDITDLDAVRRAASDCAPDAIINAAAYTNVDGAEKDVELAYRVNALGPRNLALAASECDASLVHVSTDYVFDGRGTRPYHEYDATGPRSVYGASKLAGEEAVRSWRRHFVVRTAWLYENGFPNFPATMLSLADRDEVRVVSDQHGSPTFAPHLAAALLELVDSDAFGTYHMAGSGGASWFDLTRTLYRLLEIDTAVRPVATAEFPRPAERPHYSVLETVQSPRIVLPPWQEGLAEFARIVRETGAQD